MENTKTDPLFPGKEVTLDCGLQATVYPVGVIHLRKFSKQITRLFTIFSAQKVSTEIDPATLAATMLPTILEEAMELLTDCVRCEANLEELPHWELPPIIEVWIEESFGEEKKIRPWIDAVQRVMKSLGGKDKILSQMASSFSSHQGTQSPTSSE